MNSFKFLLSLFLSVSLLFVVGQASAVLYTETLEDGVWSGSTLYTEIAIDGDPNWPSLCTPDTSNGTRAIIIGIHANSNPYCRTRAAMGGNGYAQTPNLAVPDTTTQIKVTWLQYANWASGTPSLQGRVRINWHGSSSSQTVTSWYCTDTACNSTLFSSKSITANRPTGLGTLQYVYVYYDIYRSTTGTDTKNGVLAIDNLIVTRLP